MRIVIMGPKSAGKTVTGKAFAEAAGIDFIDLDDVVIDCYRRQHGGNPAIGQIYHQVGATGFRALELRAVESLAERDWCVISVGGSTPMQAAARNHLRKNSIMVLFTASLPALWKRTLARGRMPAYLEGEQDPRAAFYQRVEKLLDVITPYADIVIDKTDMTLAEATRALSDAVAEEMHLRMRSPSSLGELVRVITFGESHGAAVGAVLDGVMPGIELNRHDIQKEMDRRRPGQNQVSTARNEPDQVEILSGVFEGRTTGAPIAMLIRNQNQKSAHYDRLKQLFRPGHADFSFLRKFGLRDHRGGGRSSGRETAGRVAAGAVARKILQGKGITFHAWAEEIGGVKGEKEDLRVIDQNPVRAADAAAARRMEARILEAKKQGDSVGGVIKLVIQGLPAGLGDPVFFKLDARLGMGMLSLGAVKAIEIGSGFEAARMTGSEHNDQMHNGSFLSNRAGGILGGISTGQDVIMRLAVKPTPSIARSQQTVDVQGADVNLEITGRHDPCIVPRLVPVVEAMGALIILDALTMQQKLVSESYE